MMRKSLTKKDVVQAIRIAARDAANSADHNPLLVEALNIAAKILETTQWRMPRKPRSRT